MKPLIERFYRHVLPEPNSGCWLWTGHTGPNNKYGYIMTAGAGSKMLSAHRASWILFQGSIPESLWVLHKCDTPPCVNPQHLFLGTAKDNMQDCFKKGRSINNRRRGEQSWHAKLNAQIVIEIKEEYSKGLVTQKELGDKYGVSPGAISAIMNGRAWLHLSPDSPQKRLEDWANEYAHKICTGPEQVKLATECLTAGYKEAARILGAKPVSK